MATYFRDFSSGDGISDFTELAHVSGNNAPSWAIQNTDEVIATSASSHLESLAWNDIDSDADRDDVEVLGLYRLPATSTTNRVFSVRVSTDSSRTCYAVRLRNADVYAYRVTGSTATQLGGDTTISLTTGNWYWVRFRIIGSAYKVKVWAEGDSEPTTGGAGDGWNVSNTDSTYSTAGSVGLLKGNNTTAHEWSMFGVGTNGDTAPSSGFAAVSFSGTVPTINGTRKTSQPAQSPTIASYFSGTETPFSYAVQSGTLPTGLSINSSTGVISGTPTVTGTQTGIVIRATDQDAATADTNSFSIAIAAAAVPDLSDVAMTSIGTTSATVNVDVYF
jgi:hypothetical protein